VANGVADEKLAEEVFPFVSHLAGGDGNLSPGLGGGDFGGIEAIASGSGLGGQSSEEFR
jgi:hypothetical protein